MALLKTLIVISDITSTCLALMCNCILQYLIHTKTPEELKPYAKILRQNSLVDTFFTLVIAVTFFEMEVDQQIYCLFQGGAFKNIPHPWNGVLLLVYIMALYFCISSDFAPFCYRYLLIVHERKMSNLEFYMMYVVTGVLSTGVAIWVWAACWPSTYPENRSNFTVVFGEFWKDEHGEYPIFIASKLDNPLMIGTVMFAMSIVFATYGSISYFCWHTINHLRETSYLMTERNRKLQKHLTITLLAQAFAPFCLAVFPVIMILSCMLFNISVTHLGLVLITTVSWVAVLNPLCVIMLVGPYREAVLGRAKNFLMQNTILGWKYARSRINPSTGIGLSKPTASSTATTGASQTTNVNTIIQTTHDAEANIDRQEIRASPM